jgi:hypothetical protein
VDNTVGTVGQTADSLLGALNGVSLLNADANLNLNLNLAAPIGLGVAANVNAAVPVDGAVPANILSSGASAYANAPQTGTLDQQLLGTATAQGNQEAAINQGTGVVSTPGASASLDPTGSVTEAGTGASASSAGSGLPSSLLNINANLDLGLDLAAPIDGAIAANANVAAPIDAAVGANVLSPDSTAIALAPQNVNIIQGLNGVASATVDQASTTTQSLPTTG